MKSEIQKAAQQLAEDAQSMKYGTVTLTVIVHAGKPTRIEKTITERRQLVDGLEAKQ